MPFIDFMLFSALVGLLDQRVFGDNLMADVGGEMVSSITSFAFESIAHSVQISSCEPTFY